MDKRLKHLNALYNFESAARHQSYSKAAEELFVSQAAISQQMRQLEESLQEKLFIRSGRSMLLTQSGEKLFNACQLGFSEVIKGLNSIQCEDIAGDLTITSTQAFCALWLMPRLYKFTQAHPEVNIKILGSNQVEDLKKKHIDLAIRFSTRDLQSDDNQMVIEYFGDDAAYPVCPPKLVENGFIKTPQDLLKCRLVSLANEKLVTWKKWFEVAGVTGYENHIEKTEVTSSDMAISAVLGGNAAALVASCMFKPYVESQQLIIPFDVKHPVEFNRYLVFDSASPKKKRIKVFSDWVKFEMLQSNG